MDNSVIFFNPFYQLLMVVFFSGLRIIYHVIHTYIPPKKSETKELSRNIESQKIEGTKNSGYWSAYYVIFGICTTYNFILLIFHPVYLTQSLKFFWISLAIALLAGFRLLLLGFFLRSSKFSRVYHLAVILYELLVLLVLIPAQRDFWSVLWIFLPMILWPITLIPANSINTPLKSPQKRFTVVQNIYIDVGFWSIAILEVILQYFGFSLGFW
ncbi:MAG: hypothetical protein ACTSRK_05835 [Promethearchaeota archaeon]